LDEHETLHTGGPQESLALFISRGYITRYREFFGLINFIIPDLKIL
jgi:hypothetical protein